MLLSRWLKLEGFIVHLSSSLESRRWAELEELLPLAEELEPWCMFSLMPRTSVKMWWVWVTRSANCASQLTLAWERFWRAVLWETMQKRRSPLLASAAPSVTKVADKIRTSQSGLPITSEPIILVFVTFCQCNTWGRHRKCWLVQNLIHTCNLTLCKLVGGFDESHWTMNVQQKCWFDFTISDLGVVN